MVVQNEGVGVVIEAGSDKQNEFISKNLLYNRVNFFLKRIGTRLVAGKAEMARSTRSGGRFKRKDGMTV